MSLLKNSQTQVSDFYSQINALASGLEKTVPDYALIRDEFFRKLEKFEHLRTPWWDNWAADACRQYIIHKAFKAERFRAEALISKQLISDLSFRIYSTLASKPEDNRENIHQDMHLLENKVTKKQEKVVVPGLDELLKKFNASLVLILTAGTSDKDSPLFAVGPVITFNNATVKELTYFADAAHKKLYNKNSSKGRETRKPKNSKPGTVKELHAFINKHPVPFLVLIWVSMHPDNLKYTPEIWIRNIVKGFFG